MLDENQERITLLFSLLLILRLCLSPMCKFASYLSVFSNITSIVLCCVLKFHLWNSIVIYGILWIFGFHLWNVFEIHKRLIFHLWIFLENYEILVFIYENVWQFYDVIWEMLYVWDVFWSDFSKVYGKYLICVLKWK